jgi:hypothetical protein
MKVLKEREAFLYKMSILAQVNSTVETHRAQAVQLGIATYVLHTLSETGRKS